MQVRTKQFAVIGLVVVLVLFLWYRMVYSSMESSASKANSAAQDAQVSASQVEHQLSNLTGGKTAKARQASLAEFQAALPADVAISDFLREVQLIRDRVGIPAAFQSISPQQPAVVGGVESISFNLTVNGTYRQLRDYVDQLMQLPRLVVIDNVAVTAGAAPGGATSGGPTGEIFAGQGAPPLVSLQMTARMFAQASPLAGVGPTTRPAASTTSG